MDGRTLIVVSSNGHDLGQRNSSDLYNVVFLTGYRKDHAPNEKS